MILKNKLFDFYFHLDLKRKNYSFFKIEDKFNLFDIYIENPLKTWWKARKYFKFPKIKIKFFYNKEGRHFPDCIFSNWGKILNISIQDLMWKDKWNSPRFEYNSRIYVSLFKRFGFCIYPEITGINEFGEKENRNLEYWEYLLDYLYYSKTLSLSSCWSYQSKIFIDRNNKDGITMKYFPSHTHLFSLNKKGLKEFKKIYEEAANNRNNKKSC